MLGKIKDSAAYISRFLEGEKYRIGIILGTGLGELGFPMPEFLISRYPPSKDTKEIY